MLMGLKIRNGFGEKELTAAVGMALHRGAAINCEDCGVKVASGASNDLNSGRGHQEGSAVPLGWPFLNGPGPQCT